jgi:hypothetical protein
MKIITKLSLFAMAAALTLPAAAEDVKFEVLPAGHGGVRFQYRAICDTPTVAVYAGGRSVGQAMEYDREPELRLVWRDTGHGTRVPQYVRVK